MKVFCFTVFIILLYSSSFCQSVAVNADGSAASPSAMLDVKSNSKGVLIPRLSAAERNSISSPAKGLLVFDNDKSAFVYWNGSQWQTLVAGNGSMGAIVAHSPVATENATSFGRELAVKGSWAAISALRKVAESYENVVYLYQKTAAGQREQKQVLTAPNATAQREFGNSMDIDGDYLVVSDYRSLNSLDKEAGAVHVYHRNGTA